MQLIFLTLDERGAFRESPCVGWTGSRPLYSRSRRFSRQALYYLIISIYYIYIPPVTVPDQAIAAPAHEHNLKGYDRYFMLLKYID